MAKIKALVVRVGQPPSLQEIDGGLESFQTIVGGYVEAVVLGRHLTLWCNEEGAVNGLAPCAYVQLPGRWLLIRGDFFITRTDDEGESVSLSADDVAQAFACIDRNCDATLNDEGFRALVRGALQDNLDARAVGVDLRIRNFLIGYVSAIYRRATGNTLGGVRLDAAQRQIDTFMRDGSLS